MAVILKFNVHNRDFSRAICLATTNVHRKSLCFCESQNWRVWATSRQIGENSSSNRQHLEVVVFHRIADLTSNETAFQEENYFFSTSLLFSS